MKYLRNTILSNQGLAIASTRIASHEVATIEGIGGSLVDDSTPGVSDIIELAQIARAKGRSVALIEQLMLATPNPKGDGGEDNTSSNSGGGEGLALAKVGIDLPFKSLTAGANISLTPNATEIEIALALGTVEFTTIDPSVLTGATLLVDDGINHTIRLTDSSGGAFVVTLPAAPTTNAKWTIRDSNDSAGLQNVTWGGNGNTVNDEGLTIDGQAASIIFDGTEWWGY